MGPYEACGCSIEDRAKRLLEATRAEVVPLYTLEKDGAFSKGNLQGIAFTTARLAAGASTLRDMIVQAWQESAETPVGYPIVNVKYIESENRQMTRALFGVD